MKQRSRLLIVVMFAAILAPTAAAQDISTLERVPVEMPQSRIAGFLVDSAAHHLMAYVVPADTDAEAEPPQARGAWMTVAGLNGLTRVALKVSADGTLATGPDPGGGVIPCSGTCVVIGGMNGLTPVALKVGSDGTLATSGSGLENPTILTTSQLPVIDITSPVYGGICDDSASNDAALELALAAVPQTSTSNGAVVFFPGSCKFTAKHTSSKNNITFRGIGGWQYIGQSVPASFLDYTGTDNFLEILGQGVLFEKIAIKTPNVLAAIAPPVIAGGNFTLTSPGSGSLTSTENFQLIYLNNNILGSDRGATLVSNEIAVTSIGTNCVTVASPSAVGDADNYEVFMSTLSGNEVRVTAPIAIGVPVQVCAAANLGTRPRVDTSAKAAIFTTSSPTLDNAELFTGNIGAFGVGGDGIIQSVGSGPLIRHSKIEGFSVGAELGNGQNIMHCMEQTLFERNGWDLIVGNGGGVDIDNCVFQFSAQGHIKLIDTNQASVVRSYFEKNAPGTVVFQMGDTAVPSISNKTVGPIATDFSNNYVQCGGQPWTVGNSPVEIVQLNGFVPGSVRIAYNSFSGCQNEFIIDNQAQIAGAGIEIRGNTSFNTAFSASACGIQCGWLTNAGSDTGRSTGVIYDDNDFLNNTSLTPVAPNFSSLSIAGSQLAVIPLVFSSASSWLRAYGDGSAGAVNCSGNLNIGGGVSGEFWVSSFTVSNGNTCSINGSNGPLVIRSTGTITIAGTINATTSAGNLGTGDFGGSGGGGGGGTLAGAIGSGSIAYGTTLLLGGAAGTSSGGNGGAGGVVSVSKYLPGLSGNPYPRGGALGGAGGSSGGAGGAGGIAVVLVAPTIDFQSTGVIDVSGQAGVASVANSTGAGGGGGAGYIILSAITYTNNLGTSIVQGAPGGSNENPAVVLSVPASGLGNITTSGTGAIAHISTFAGGNPTVITVDAAGSGYNYTPTCAIVGNGGGANTGSGASCTVTMAGSSPNKTVSSIAVSGGNAGYGTGTTYTTSGLGGYGAVGWMKSLTIQ